MNPYRAEPGSGVALSTVGLSAYNLVAARGGKGTLDELLMLLPGVGCRATVREIQMALSTLEDLRRIELDGGELELRDPQCRRVVTRDRTGDGWNDWLVQDARRGLLHLDREVLA